MLSHPVGLAGLTTATVPLLPWMVVGTASHCKHRAMLTPTIGRTHAIANPAGRCAGRCARGQRSDGVGNVAGTARRLLEDPLFYLIGWHYRDDALGWLRCATLRSARSAARFGSGGGGEAAVAEIADSLRRRFVTGSAGRPRLMPSTKPRGCSGRPATRPS